MFANRLNNKFSSLLFRSAQLQQLIDSERGRAKTDALRLMRLTSLRLRILNALNNLLAAPQPCTVRVSTQMSRLPRG